MHTRFIYRQITSSLKQTLVFVACVALSLVTLVSLGGFGESINNALLRDARKLLAADLVVESGFPYEPTLQAKLDALRSETGVRVAQTYEFITIVRAVGAEDTLLTELKTVEAGYPFYGEVQLQSGRRLAQVLKAGQIIVGQNLLDRMGLSIGDPLQIGSLTVTIADVVLSEPDQPVDFFSLGPRVFLAADDLQKTGLIKPGSRVRYRALVQVTDESRLESLAQELRQAADPRLVEVSTYRTNQQAVQRFFDDFLTFLSLIGIFTLLLAGIGIQSSLGAFIREREDTIAILRTFGATSRFIMLQFFGIAAVLGLAGTLIGLALGIAMQWIFPVIFGPFLPPQVEFVLSLRAILEGVMLGFFVVAIFTFLPIYQLQELKPHFIFRKESGTPPRRWVFVAAQGLILLFVTGMTFRYLQNAERTFYFAVGILSLVLIITLLTRLVLFILRRQKIAALDLRQAVRGLFRPRNATTWIIVTLAASLAVLFTIYLIERNLDASFVQAYPDDAPNVVLLDIQPDQREPIRAILGPETEFIPLVRARLNQINGETIIPQEDSGFGQPGGPNPDEPPRLDRIFSLTYRADLEPFERLVAGESLFSPEDLGAAQVSVLENLREVYPFQVGDRLQFDIQGVRLEAVVTSLRAVQEERDFGPPAFNFVFREQDLVKAPQTILTTTTIPENDIAHFQNELVADFPNVTVIDITTAINTVASLVADITVIIRFFTIFSIAAGVLIIISSVLATRFARIQESVYFKVLGAKQRFVLRVFALENVFIGLVSALLALLLSQLASWILVTQIFKLSYGAYWGSSILLMLFTVALVTTVGLLASVSILKKKPISFLREQTVE